MPVSNARTYVIAVKREHRADVPGDWIDTVRGVKGLVVREPANSKRIVVTGPQHAVALACAKLSGFVYAEELIRHEIA
jgi:hypothetical protein